ncbi:MAG: DUF2071 domain-containing protein [Bacteroidota bacterium]
MSILKKIPIRYQGELHDIMLVNFSVEKAEILPMLPDIFTPKDFEGRALISMVNVKLKKMRPAFLPKGLHFSYQHVAFRLLIEDRKWNADGRDHGIFFLNSYTNRLPMIWGGRLLTDYRLNRAELWNHKHNLDLRAGDNIIRYTIDPVHPPDNPQQELTQIVGAVDRAYCLWGKQDVRRTQIVREQWPLQTVNPTSFQTNFFRTARLEGIFRVPEVIHYHWLPPVSVGSKVDEKNHPSLHPEAINLRYQ